MRLCLSQVRLQTVRCIYNNRNIFGAWTEQQEAGRHILLRFCLEHIDTIITKSSGTSLTSFSASSPCIAHRRSDLLVTRVRKVINRCTRSLWRSRLSPARSSHGLSLKSAQEKLWIIMFVAADSGACSHEAPPVKVWKQLHTSVTVEQTVHTHPFCFNGSSSLKIVASLTTALYDCIGRDNMSKWGTPET